jgi:hypothetical protein
MGAFFVLIALFIVGFLAFWLLRLMCSHGGTILKFCLRSVLLPCLISLITGFIVVAITGDPTITSAGALGSYIAAAFINKDIFNA